MRTTWKADWLLEFSIALVVLGTLTREAIFAAVGSFFPLTLAALGLIFQRRLGVLGRGLHVEQQLSSDTVYLGDRVSGELRIRNESGLAAQILSVQGILEKTLRLELQPLTIRQPLQPAATFASTFNILALARGRFKISGFRLTLTDANDLFTGEVTWEQASWIEVYPGTETAGALTPLVFYGGRVDIFHRSMDPAGDHAGIRKYEYGDESTRIEWKATARLGTLMVKEFNPETGIMLQILIDASRTMQQRSYVGTRLDEALAVARLLVESTGPSVNSVGITVYDETKILKAIEPARASEQLTNLRDLALTLRAEAETTEAASGTAPPRASLQTKPALLSERLAAFLRLLRSRLLLDYRNTGVHKALTQARATGPEVSTIVLTDLQTNNEALVEAASSQRGRVGPVIIAQIGAPWRLCGSIEEAYVEYQRNSRMLRRLDESGITVFDLRPESLVRSITEYVGRPLAQSPVQWPQRL